MAPIIPHNMFTLKGENLIFYCYDFGQWSCHYKLVLIWRTALIKGKRWIKISLECAAYTATLI